MKQIRNLRSRRTPGVLLLALATLFAGACDGRPTGPVEPGDGNGGPGTPPPVAQVTVSPGGAQLLLGDTLRLTAAAKSADGTVLLGRAVTWQSFNPGAATVSASGLVTAVGAGTAVVRALIDGIGADVSIGVTALNPVPSVSSVSPDVVETTTPVAVLSVRGEGFAAGAMILWDGVPRPAFYVGPDEVRLVLGPADIQAAGTRTVAVQNPAPGGGVSASLPVTITVGVSSVVVTPSQLILSVGQSATLFARALDSEGMELPGRPFTFTSSNAGAVAVSATGVVTANHVGPAIITVTSGGRSAQVTVTAVAPVQVVWLSPNPAAALVGQTVQLTARTFAAGLVELTGRTVTWSSENPAIATVDAAGRVTGVTKGTTRIRAESEGVVAWVNLDVRQWGPGPVSALALRGFTETIVWPEVGNTTWVDGQGSSHAASQVLWGGTLTMRFDTGRWERTYDIRVYVGTTMVGTESWTDQGAFGYVISGGYWFRSDSTGQTVHGNQAVPGELQINQGVGTSQALTQRWVLN